MVNVSKIIRKYPDIFCTFGLVLIVGALYFPSVFFDFLFFDDPEHVIGNPLIQSLSFHNILAIFQQLILGVYVPLTILSFAIEYKLFGLNPFFFHLDNVLLHCVVTLLVYQLGIKLGLSRVSSLVGSILFGVHPIHVPSVVWITERKDVLYSVFYLLTLLTWLKFIEKMQKRYYVLSLLLCLNSMLAKSMAVSLPLMLLLLDWFKGQTNIKNCIIQKIPFFAVCLGIGFITHLHNQSVFNVDENWFRAVLQCIWTIMFYIYSFVWPFHLAPIYQTQEPIDLTNPVYALSLIGFVSLTILMIKFRKSKWIMFSVMTYVIMIFFMWRFSALKNQDVVADRFMYLPCVGFCYLFGRSIENFSRQRRIVAAAITTVLVVFSFVTLQYSQHWKNDLKFWDFVIKRRPNFSKGYLNRGVALLELNQTEKAINDFNQSYALDPFQLKLFLSRGTAYVLTKQYSLALKDYNQALDLDPNSIPAYFNRAVVHELMGDDQKAVEDYTLLLQKEATWQAYYNRGVLLKKMGEEEASERDFTEAIKRNPDLLNAKGTRP